MTKAADRIVKHKWPVLEATNPGKPPFGYLVNDRRTTWTPIPEALDALEVAKDLLSEGISTRECAEWLANYTGHPLSHQGFIKRIKRDNKFYQGWSKSSHNRPSDTKWVSSKGDYGDSKLHWPESKPKAVPQNKGRRKRQELLRGKTPEEREIIRHTHNITEAKRLLTRNQKQLKAKLKDNSNEELTKLLPSNLVEELQSEEPVEVKQDIIFQPHPGPQTDFLASTEDVIFYGGAKGGGKSYALIADPVRYFGMPKFKGLILRRTNSELKDLIKNSKELYEKAWPGSTYHKTDKLWTFPSGATMEFGFCETEDDAERYRGIQYHWVGVDEIPQYAHRGPFDALMSCIRSADPGYPTQFRCTGNPGNIGSQWVKELFIDPSPPNTTFWREAEIKNPVTGETRIVRKSYKYIPATVYDNPSLLQDDSYLATLAMLPEIKRKQMLEGNWDISAGGAFPEFDRSIHVIKPFDIPSNWMTFRSADWGYSSPFCLLHFAVDFDDNLYVFREWYDQGIYDDTWAEEIARIETDERIYCEHGVIDGSISTSRGSRADDSFDVINKILAKYRLVKFKKADRSPGSRKEGKLAVHRMLALKETGRRFEDGTPETAPSLFIFDTCVNLIRTLPILLEDPKNPELVLKKNSDDHCFDALQYGIRSFKSNARRKFSAMDKITTKRPLPADPVFGY